MFIGLNGMDFIYAISEHECLENSQLQQLQNIRLEVMYRKGCPIVSCEYV